VPIEGAEEFMLLARSLMMLLLTLLVPAVGWAGLPVPGVELAGRAYAVRFNLNMASRLPAGAMITCKARIIPHLAESQKLNGQAEAVPVETATGVATVTGSMAVCAVEIPFSWTMTDAGGGALLSYEIDAVSVVYGAQPIVVRSSAQEGIPVTYPAMGGTANLSFSVTF